MGFSHPLLYVSSSAGYEAKPSQSIVILGKKTHINALGTRGAELAPTAGKDAPRVLCLGDSVTNGGIQMSDEQTYPMLLQSALSVDVLNASAGGWAVQNEQKWLAEHGTMGARVIVLEVNESDLFQPFEGPDLVDRNPTFPSRAPSSALAAVVRRYVLPRLGLWHEASDPGSTPTSTTYSPSNTKDVMAAINLIFEQARESKAQLVLMYWDMRKSQFASEEEVRRLLAWAEDNGVPVVRPQLNLRPDAAKLYSDKIHPNPGGNVLIVQQLAQTVRPLLH